jgi:hypothetical protein
MLFPNFMMAAGQDRTPVQASYAGASNYDPGSSFTSYTHSNVPIGAADSNRKLIILHFAGGSLGTSAEEDQLTVDGSNATFIKRGFAHYPWISVWAIDKPTGTTANIAVAQTGNAIGFSRVEVYRCFDVEPDGIIVHSRSLNNVGSTNGSGYPVAYFAPKDATIIVAANTYRGANSTTYTVSWPAGFTEQTDVCLNQGGTGYARTFSSAVKANLTAYEKATVAVTASVDLYSSEVCSIVLIPKALPGAGAGSTAYGSTASQASSTTLTANDMSLGGAEDPYRVAVFGVLNSSVYIDTISVDGTLVCDRDLGGTGNGGDSNTWLRSVSGAGEVITYSCLYPTGTPDVSVTWNASGTAGRIVACSVTATRAARENQAKAVVSSSGTTASNSMNVPNDCNLLSFAWGDTTGATLSSSDQTERHEADAVSYSFGVYDASVINDADDLFSASFTSSVSGNLKIMHTLRFDK